MPKALSRLSEQLRRIFRIILWYMKCFLLTIGLLIIAGVSDVAAATLYRSVGTTATALNNAATVTISGSVATFSAAQPDNIGVGDAIVYGSTYIAFITFRTSTTTFNVQNATGGVPTAAGAGTSVAVYRCFNSLSNWEGNTTANTNINAAVRPSVLMSSLNLVTAGHILMVSCYADGVDGSVTIDGWTTGASNYIKIYTPVNLLEAGTSQRHNGTWGNGYRITGYLIISDEYVRVDGLSVYQSGANRIYFVTGSTGAGEVHISNCFGWYTNDSATGFDVYDVWSVGALTIKVWNCIGINDSASTTSEAFYFNDADITVYCYNCTGIANAGRAFRNVYTNPATLKNCLGYSASNSAFYGSFTSVTYSASDDVTADDWGGSGNRISQTFSFVDSANDNFHLLPADIGAVDRGVDLVADSYISFFQDIDAGRRPMGPAWDIGADEVIPPGFFFTEY